MVAKENSSVAKRAQPIDRKKLAKKSIPLVEKGNFCRYFATMIRSGTPILEAVEILSTETQNKTFAKMLMVIKEDLKSGKSLGESFRQFPRAFDPVFLTVVKAGEESGTLDRALEYLGRQIIADYYLLQRVRGALLYPLIIVTAMIVLGFIMLGGVLPRIAKVFLSSGLPIPSVTQIIFKTSLFFEKNLLFIIIGFIICLVGLGIFFFKGKGKVFMGNFLPKLPLVRKIFSDLDVARFARVLGTLLESGVPITGALKIASTAFTLPDYRVLGQKLESGVAKGSSMKEILHSDPKVKGGFPRMVSGMIAIGEETGSLEKVLFDVADFYDQEVDNALKNFTTVLEPVLMIAVGVAVAFMVLSIITPIYSLVGSLRLK